MRKKYYVLSIIISILLCACSNAHNDVNYVDTANYDIENENDDNEYQNVDQSQVKESNDFIDEIISIEQEEEIDEILGVEEAVDDSVYDFSIDFAGDINFGDDHETTRHLEEMDGNLSDVISPELIEHMKNADLSVINNEFVYSTIGAPLEGKAYTFRSNPDHIKYIIEMGVDVANLANNHIYDYGKDAFLDMLDVLEANNMSYIGAGRNLSDAMKPFYTEIDGKRIAIVAASRAEKMKMTPQATDAEPGILRCYDTELFLQEIREAKSNADFVIAFVHWGTEYSYELEEVQLSTGKEYLDAGADAIIGAHSHCLQGMEYYDGKPILYSLGNFWFNDKTLDTMLISLHFYGNSKEDHLEVTIIPAIQSNCETKIAEGEEKERIFQFLDSISVNTHITPEGVLTQVTE